MTKGKLIFEMDQGLSWACIHDHGGEYLKISVFDGHDLSTINIDRIDARFLVESLLTWLNPKDA